MTGSTGTRGTGPFDVRIPELGESVTKGVIVRWAKRDGDNVAEGDALVELATDKASFELPARTGGILRILRHEGETVRVGEIVARIEMATAGVPVPIAEPNLEAASEQDVIYPWASREVGPTPAAAFPGGAPVAPAPAAPGPRAEGEERVRMTPTRKRIAERLVQARRTAAILTTFNELDLSAVLEMRARLRDRFQELHGMRLGLMSFFARAAITALAEFPVLNAEIRGDDVVYRRFVHLGIAVATERGLIVPVVHHAERMSFADLERKIERLARVAREGTLRLEELSAGTFTISNAGVFGSLLSTPILNPPQSGILGMHKVEKRPIVIDDRILVRPMMYVALSYDHRLVDGEQAVRFLVRVKERLEDPMRLLVGV
jgi:2-oxoglutarate dehydrogenase E2 component (dihydrolipoamide succinyltransferase)